jgi:hypothetical protein
MSDLAGRENVQTVTTSGTAEPSGRRPSTETNFVDELTRLRKRVAELERERLVPDSMAEVQAMLTIAASDLGLLSIEKGQLKESLASAEARTHEQAEKIWLLRGELKAAQAKLAIERSVASAAIELRDAAQQDIAAALEWQARARAAERDLGIMKDAHPTIEGNAIRAARLAAKDSDK